MHNIRLHGPLQPSTRTQGGKALLISFHTLSYKIKNQKKKLLTNGNTEQTPHENIEENEMNLARSQNLEQQVSLATSGDLCK